MAYAWIENNRIFVSKNKPPIENVNILEVPDNTLSFYLTIDNRILKFKTQNELLSAIKIQKQEELLSLEKRRVNEILDKYKYLSLGDLQFYANQNDTEAKALLNWYLAYDNLIWSYIDNDLSAFTSVDELLAVDMKNIEEQTFNQAVQTAPLP
ncbi:MAG: hypothetical protein DSY47_00105 [Hydrogenothermus sp.]|nr:MAG: hypothetical protein DSY47_00105 [Hydrogenothermus sp.]